MEERLTRGGGVGRVKQLKPRLIERVADDTREESEFLDDFDGRCFFATRPLEAAPMPGDRAGGSKCRGRRRLVTKAIG